jgi:hypothetical protein
MLTQELFGEHKVDIINLNDYTITLTIYGDGKSDDKNSLL